MKYLDDKLVESFTLEVQQTLAQAIEFAVTYRQNEGERDPEELRQAAQDALAEITPAFVPALEEAYRRSPLGAPDFEAVALLFKRLAIRAKLRAVVEDGEGGSVSVSTRKGEIHGAVINMGDHDGQVSVCIINGTGEERWVALDSIQDLAA